MRWRLILQVLLVGVLVASACTDGTVSTTNTTNTTAGAPATTQAAATTTTSTRPAATTTKAPDPGGSLLVVGFAGFLGHEIWEGVLVIENSSARTIVIEFVEVIFHTASDAVNDPSSFFQQILYPGTNYLNIQLFPAAEPEMLDVNYIDVSYVDAGRFTISNVEVSQTGSILDVSGEVRSSFAEDHDFVQLTTVFFSADGDPLYSDLSFIDLVEAGGVSLFNESVFLNDASPAWDYVEVYAQP